MIVKQEDQIEALSGILAQQMLEPNYKVREYFVRTYVCLLHTYKIMSVNA